MLPHMAAPSRGKTEAVKNGHVEVPRIHQFFTPNQGGLPVRRSTADSSVVPRPAVRSMRLTNK